ncbi:M6 family metalloprotease domain-containing protein [Streptomyces sp. DEF1AK]|uniref:M6 family metalloprotease domain-containing protein n=1 Tax=Streptomyces sp. DEF1AK TaxID=2759677 RepID=UPI00191651C8|nr:M6 family metalloprotease domain-containing protein [Streptomyces sp. DEF1AK]MBK3390887.1 M6 family metalloprotease domain-containing protein [Streptomyces sp. DEF1AK]
MPSPTDPEAALPRQEDPREHAPAARAAGAERVTPRALGAGAVALLALVATSLVAGPASAAPPGGPCALPRTPAHHSEGLATWNGAYPRPLGSLDAVLVFLSFPDATPRTTPAELTADYFPDATNFFDRSSYGRFTLRPHPQKEWLTMPQPSTAYEIRRDWNAASRSAYLRDALKAADPVVDFSRYDIVYFVADPDAPGVDSDATKVVNFSRPLEADGTPIRRVVTLFERHPPDRNVLAHETGHVFDLPDLYHRPTDNKGDWDTHVGDWDLMGSQFGLGPDLFAWHKWKLGWLGHQQITCVQGEGSHRLSLEPVAADAPLPGSGTRLAVVPEGPGTVIAVEARTAEGNDVDVCREGILVYRVRTDLPSGAGPVEVLDAHPDTAACWGRSVYPDLADAPVQEGETFTVPGTAPGEGVRVEVEDRTPSGSWTVNLTTRL